MFTMNPEIQHEMVYISGNSKNANMDSNTSSNVYIKIDSLNQSELFDFSSLNSTTSVVNFSQDFFDNQIFLNKLIQPSTDHQSGAKELSQYLNQQDDVEQQLFTINFDTELNSMPSVLDMQATTEKNIKTTVATEVTKKQKRKNVSSSRLG